MEASQLRKAEAVDDANLLVNILGAHSHFQRSQAKNTKLGAQESVIPKAMACYVDVSRPRAVYHFREVVGNLRIRQAKDVLRW